MIVVVAHPETPRLRVRRVDETAVASRTIARSAAQDLPVLYVEHGGTVCNSYKYPAVTECVVVFAVPRIGREPVAAVYCARVPANKTTSAGAAGACLLEVRDVFDKRHTDDTARGRIRKWRGYLAGLRAAMRDLERAGELTRAEAARVLWLARHRYLRTGDLAALARERVRLAVLAARARLSGQVMVAKHAETELREIGFAA